MTAIVRRRRGGLLTTVALLVLGASPPDWDAGESRWFATGRFDAGAILKATGQFGYGRPYWMWAGLQTSATTTHEFFATTAGVRLALPALDFMAEYRRTEGYLRGPVAQAATYDSEHLLDSTPGGYDAIDLDLWSSLPLPYSYVYLEVAATWLPDSTPRYEELFRAVVTGWSGIARVAFGGRVGDLGWIRFGFLTEVLISERDVEPLIRIGPSLHLILGRHTDLIFATLWPVADGDNLDLIDTVTGALALRWRIVTGEDEIEFP